MIVNIKKPFLDKVVDEVQKVEMDNKPIESITFTSTEEVIELYKIFLSDNMSKQTHESRKKWIKDFKNNKSSGNYLLGYPINYKEGG